MELPGQIGLAPLEYLTGAWVRISEGPFTGIDAQVVVDKGREIVVILQMFGRKMTASMFPEVLSPGHAARL